MLCEVRLNSPVVLTSILIERCRSVKWILKSSLKKFRIRRLPLFDWIAIFINYRGKTSYLEVVKTAPAPASSELWSWGCPGSCLGVAASFLLCYPQAAKLC